MTRLSKIDSFKSVAAFSEAVDTAHVRKKTFGGFNVALTVRAGSEQKTIHLTRNQLAKLADKVFVTHRNEQNFNNEFLGLANKLVGLENQGEETTSCITKLKQKIGSTIFKMHFKMDRAEFYESRISLLESINRLSKGQNILGYLLSSFQG